jgi:hypothetical protein
MRTKAGHHDLPFAASRSPILQFRIELLGIQPLIWRRIQVPGDYTFWDLHVAIQGAFAWNDSHLHEFKVTTRNGNRISFGLPVDGDFDRGPDGALLEDWRYRVADYLHTKSQRIEYLYDFGDNWDHIVIFEEALAKATGKTYPRCTAGERSGPPDDCGGPHGYESLLEILAAPSHEKYKSSHAWAARMKGARGKFDPEAFDEQAVQFANPAPRLKRMLEETGW